MDEDTWHSLRPGVSASKPPGDRTDGVIEVYPAGTLKALGLRSRGYNGTARTVRSSLVSELAKWMTTGPHTASLTTSNHLLDAALCTLAAADFRAGACIPPPPGSLDRVHRVGWIWVRTPLGSKSYPRML